VERSERLPLPLCQDDLNEDGVVAMRNSLIARFSCTQMERGGSRSERECSRYAFLDVDWDASMWTTLQGAPIVAVSPANCVGTLICNRSSEEHAFGTTPNGDIGFRRGFRGSFHCAFALLLLRS
jgi:hypothetical protein